MLKKVYVILGAFLVGGYTLASLRGWELESATKQPLPASVRQSPGGYRSFHFWHSGFRGGK